MTDATETAMNAVGTAVGIGVTVMAAKTVMDMMDQSQGRVTRKKKKKKMYMAYQHEPEMIFG